MAFAKLSRDFSKRMPAKARRLARDSAILSKILDRQLVIIDNLGFEQPKTSAFAKITAALKIDGSCLVGLAEPDGVIYLSSRNIKKVKVLPVGDFNAYDVLSHNKLLVTSDGMEVLIQQAAQARGQLAQADAVAG